MKMAEEVLRRYDNFTKNFVPWEKFKAPLDGVKKKQGDSYDGIDLQIVTIKQHIKNGIDAYFGASQKIQEWAGIIVSHLELYISLFDGNDAKNAESQKELFIEMLEWGVAQMNGTQVDLANCLSNLVSASGTIKASSAVVFGKWISYDFAVKRPTILWYSHRSKDKVYLIEKMINLREIVNMYVELREKVERTTQNIFVCTEMLRTQTEAIIDLKKQIQPMTLSGDDWLDLRDIIIKDVQHLIANSQEFRKKHTKTHLDSQ